MPLPLAALLIPAAVGAAANIYSGVRQGRAADRAAEAAKRDARRAAIERAMGGTSISRGQTVVNPPDLTIPSIIGQLANVGGTVAGSYYDRKA
jgi:hypothetical protein